MRMPDPFSAATHFAEYVKRGGVNSNLLVLAFFALAALLVSAMFAPVIVTYFLMGLIGLVVATIIFTHCYVLVCKDPNLLRSEAFGYNMKKLEILGDQFHNARDISGINTYNPDRPDLSAISIPDPDEIELPREE